MHGEWFDGVSTQYLVGFWTEKMAPTNMGYDVVEHAASAEEAVKTTVELEPDLILMRAIILEQESIISN